MTQEQVHAEWLARIRDNIAERQAVEATLERGHFHESTRVSELHAQYRLLLQEQVERYEQEDAAAGRTFTDSACAPHVRAIVDTLPPLTAEDCERLAPLWRPGVLAVRKKWKEDGKPGLPPFSVTRA